MAEFSIAIYATNVFDPAELEVSSGDLVSWSNRTDFQQTITIDNQPLVKPMVAEPWEPTSAYKVTASVTYNTGSGSIKVVVLALMMLLAGLFAPSLQAQTGKADCSALMGGELENPQEVSWDENGVGTLVTVGEKQLLAFLKKRVDGPINKDTDITCVAQWVRTYRKDPPSESSQQPNAPARPPQPGPTIRTQVGALVKLTFLNLIDPLNFPGTDTGRCDQAQGNSGELYPFSGEPPAPPPGDRYPNCFHGSVYTNVHYHGSHTSPSSTADNVFLQIIPSPRSRDNKRVPAVTAGSVQASFDEFYRDCALNLNDKFAPQQWPKIWDDLPTTYRNAQFTLMCGTMTPDECKATNPLYKNNSDEIAKGVFPQNYVGAFPYCFRLPVYRPPAAAATATAEHGEHGDAAQTATQRPLEMGQAPGTHWYHAHKHGSTTINVSNGMTGVLLIQDNEPGGYDYAIKKFYRDEYGLDIQQKILVLNQIGGTPNREGGNDPRPGQYFSVNGKLQPTITMKQGEVQLWRIADTSSRTGVIFSPDGNVQWRQLAQDGVQFSDTNYKESENQEMVMASGNRIDLLVRAPQAGKFPVTVTLTADPTTDRTTRQLLFYVNVTAPANSTRFMDNAPVLPPYLNDIGDVPEGKPLVFSTTRKAAPRPDVTGFTNQFINGKPFDHSVGASVPLNESQQWMISNTTTNIAHPFHIHVNPFQITTVFEPNSALRIEKGAGTVSIPASSPNVTGSDPNFTTNLRPGWVLNINGTRRTVLSIQSPTTLTLTANNGSTAVTNASYTVNVPRYVFLNDPKPLDGQCYLNPSDPLTWKPCAAVPQPPAAERIWWDVFSIPTAISVSWAGTPSAVNVPGYFTMRSRFVDYPGYFVLHCHILAHEDRGMMTIVNVHDQQQVPFTHH